MQALLTFVVGAGEKSKTQRPKRNHVQPLRATRKARKSRAGEWALTSPFFRQSCAQ